MAGNVEEWTATAAWNYDGTQADATPHMHRGGNWMASNLRCAKTP
jgi:hypothetical protein